jgi:hypothetical protein
MSRSTQYIITIREAVDEMGKATQRLASELDAEQFQLAGICVGRLRELAQKVVDITKLIEDPLWWDSGGAGVAKGK